MPRIIFKCPHIKGGTSKAASHLGNMVEYIATREGVQEVEFNRVENYVEYIAKRPRAHGLFTGSKDPLVLSRIQKEVANHPGTVWLPIISLTREDAAQLGYDNAESWRKLLSSYALEMAQAMKIPPEQFRWYAAFHDEKTHPHVHMVCYSADGKSGFLSENGIAKIKSGLAKQIFRHDLTEIYAKQTQQRDALNLESQKRLRQLIQQMQDGSLDNECVAQLMLELSRQLKTTSGKKQYGYLRPPLKALVDEIVDELERDGRVAAAYNLWYEMREEVLRTYKNDLPERIPLSRQKEFKRIKNIVVQEAVRLGEQLEQRVDNSDASNPRTTPAGQRDENHSSALLLHSVTKLLHHMSRIFQEQQQPVSPVYHTDRKLLKKLREKKIAHGHKPDDHAPRLS